MSWYTKRAVWQAIILSRSKPQTPWPPVELNCGAVIVYEFCAGQIPNFG